MVLYAGFVGLTRRLHQVPNGFVPAQDKYYLVIAQLPSGASLDRTEAGRETDVAIALAEPGVESVVVFPACRLTAVNVCQIR